jgi:transcriptional regulator with XRE-family HTH domain
MDIFAILGARIRFFRKERQLTQSTLALKAKISRVYLSNLENGHENPTFLTLLQLSNALKVPLSVLLDGM